MNKKKTNAKKKTSPKKPTVQEQLLELCALVNKLSEKIAQLQLEVGSLRPQSRIPCSPAQSPFEGFKPWKQDPPSIEVTCMPPPGAMYLGRNKKEG